MVKRKLHYLAVGLFMTLGIATEVANADVMPISPSQDLQVQKEYLSEHPVLTESLSRN